MSEQELTIYVAIGNSDDRLNQVDWAKFTRLIVNTIRAYATQVHGVWYSAPDAEFQNACVCFQLESSRRADLREQLVFLRATYHQDAVAWTEVVTPAEML